MRELKIEESKLVAGGVAPAIPIAAGAAAGFGVAGTAMRFQRRSAGPIANSARFDV